MAKFADGTAVTVERSRSEIERVLTKYGATAFMYGWQTNTAAIQFEARGRRVRFLLPMPEQKDFVYTPTNIKRTPDAQQKAYDAEVRRLWRALSLVIKAKLEAVDAGIVSFESEFLAHVVLNSGETVGNWLAPQLEASYASGKMPPMLPG